MIREISAHRVVAGTHAAKAIHPQPTVTPGGGRVANVVARKLGVASQDECSGESFGHVDLALRDHGLPLSVRHQDLQRKPPNGDNHAQGSKVHRGLRDRG